MATNHHPYDTENAENYKDSQEKYMNGETSLLMELIHFKNL